MFENLVSQSAVKLLISDIEKNTLPSSILFSGSESSGKLSAALEMARILSCHENPQGKWTCTCPSCLRHKALTCTNMVLLGNRNCSLEISAAKDTFVKAYRDNEKYLDATRYLFLRSIRKLTLRFSDVIIKGESNVNKVGSIMETINENLELLDFPRELPQFDQTVKICDELLKLSDKLENECLYNTISINQIRNMEEWARIKSEDGKKTIIIENADRMYSGVRNALLKIIEEPPTDCIFILLTSKRNAVMQTILSRVRTYNFKDRTLEQQQKVIKLIFHNEYFNGSINEYLLTYLPVPASKIREEAKKFFLDISKGVIPKASDIIKNCVNFDPKIEFKIFLIELTLLQKKILKTQAGCEVSAEIVELLRKCWDNVTLYNQSILSNMELLIRDLTKINNMYGKILCAAM